MSCTNVLLLSYYNYDAAPNLRSDSESDFSPSNSEDEDDDDEEHEGNQHKTPSKHTPAAALYKTPSKKSKKAAEVRLSS